MENPVIAVVDYGMGNINSVKYALEYLGCSIIVTSSPSVLSAADAIVLPGVGAFGEAMGNLKQLKLVEVLTEQVLVQRKPFLGICLGMQLIAQSSMEKGKHQGLGWIEGEVVPFDLPPSYRVPHMGWNEVIPHKHMPLFEGLKKDFNFYFVHSYHLQCPSIYVAAHANYGMKLTVALQHDNILATQFHPERSHHNGLRLLKNFIQWIQTRS